MYRGIVTHNDLDGVGSAALCSWAYRVNRILFTGPVDILNARFPITAEDIVCDLPYPSECGLWFDHHRGNLADLAQRGIAASSVPGRFGAERSCGRVVLRHLEEEGRRLPEHFGGLVNALDVVDSFDYADVAQWRARTPAHTVSDAMKVPFGDFRDRNQFFRNVVFHLRDYGLEKTAQLAQVRRLHGQYVSQEEKMLELLQLDARPFDAEGDVVVVDLTRHNQRPFVWKNLAQLLFPEAGAVLSVEAAFREGRKTNDLALSMALTIRQNRGGEAKDIGEILRVLNIGDGHPGAGGGRVACGSKEEMSRTKDEMVRRIVALWRAQRKEAVQ